MPGSPGRARYTRDFAKRRNPDAGNMSRLYVIESTPEFDRGEGGSSAAGAGSRNRSASRERWLPELVGRYGTRPACAKGEQQICRRRLRRICRATRGSSVVIAGDHQPPAVHALAHAINQALGNVGKTVIYTDPVDANPVNQTESLQGLVADMRAGKVDMLLILAAILLTMRPRILDSPTRSEIECHSAEEFISASISNETAELCQWHVQRGALSRIVGRCPRLRRHGQHCAAADCAALRRQERA